MLIGASSQPGGRHRLSWIASALRRWNTPRQLRWARALVVFLCLASGVVSVYDARVRVADTREIADRTEPLAADVVELYRSLADADATIATEFLLDSSAPGVRARYDDGIAQAALSLVGAASRVGGRRLASDRIGDIAAQVPVYTGLVEQARANNRPGSSGGEQVRRASELMQKTILRRAESLQRNEFERLREQYRRAGSAPVLAVAVAVASLGSLAGVQVFLIRKTKRLLNVGLAAATVALLGTSAWWANVLNHSRDNLERSQQHSQSISGALAQAQIAARQARASELIGLFATTDREPYEEDFSAKTQRIVRDDGAGGALGAARRLLLSRDALADADAAIAQTAAWTAAHERRRGLRGAGDDETALIFNHLDTTLSAAVAGVRSALGPAIARSQDGLDGLAVTAGFAALASAGASGWGLGLRLEEYR